MLHIDDTVKDLTTGRLYKVAAIYAGHAVGDGLRNAEDQISIPITAGTQDIVHTDLYAVTLCGHNAPAAKSSDYAVDLAMAYSHNFGVAERALESIERIAYRTLEYNVSNGDQAHESAYTSILESIRCFVQNVQSVPSSDGRERPALLHSFPYATASANNTPTPKENQS